MESIRKSNTLDSQGNKMTLKDYFRSLPEAIYPKKEFVERIAELTGATTTSVRNWFVYGMKPRDARILLILQEETGIAPEDMWRD